MNVQFIISNICSTSYRDFAVRVIFLDFDGVLHPLSASDQPQGQLEWLPILGRLLDTAPDVRIVIHSTWRYRYTDAELRALLGGLGPRFIGSAPRLPREQAIELVLQSNKGSITSHLVLDDDPREFTSGRLHLALCDPSRGISARSTQALVSAWLRQTGPAAKLSAGSRLPRGFGELVLYLDFDGVLHHENTLWHPKRGAYAGPPGYQLFEHADLLASILAPYPEVHIVLSTSWVRRYGCYGSAKRLPAELRERVIGSTFHSQMDENAFSAMPRGQQVLEDVLRRKPRDWVALDDVDEGWPKELRGHVLITDERLGLTAPGIVDALRSRIERMHGSP
ncbi:MAG: HAD domain-containing protein [Hydrogenophaga sp.]|uniref:HAD domain-containing protein n=1 Tax=Hydrogenophaga sp. TaxID=1904254 RepID=UPI0040372B15